MGKNFRSEDEVKEALQSKVGKVNTVIWDYLIKKFYVNEVLEGMESLSNLVKEYRKLQQFISQAAKEDGLPAKAEFPVTKKEGSSVITREDIIFSKILAYEMGKVPAVKKFRREALKGVLVKSESLKSWVQTMQEKDGPPTRYLKVKDRDVSIVTEGDRVLMKGCFSPTEEILGLEVIDLTFPGDDGWVNTIPVNASGILGQLKKVADKIIKFYCPVWKEYQAVGFILTGKVPLISKVRYSYKIIPGMPLQITMKLNARITPKALSEEYTKIRQKLLKKKRVKPLQEKSLTLVEFFLEYDKNDFTWKELMQMWNEYYPKWAYNEYSNFQKDCRRAINWFLGSRVTYNSILKSTHKSTHFKREYNST